MPNVLLYLNKANKILIFVQNHQSLTELFKYPEKVIMAKWS